MQNVTMIPILFFLSVNTIANNLRIEPKYHFEQGANDK